MKKIIVFMLFIFLVFSSGCIDISPFKEITQTGKVFKVNTDKINYNGETCEIDFSIKNIGEEYTCIDEISASIIDEEGSEIQPYKESFGAGPDDFCFYPSEKHEGYLEFRMENNEEFTLYMRIIHSEGNEEELYKENITSHLFFNSII